MKVGVELLVHKNNVLRNTECLDIQLRFSCTFIGWMLQRHTNQEKMSVDSDLIKVDNLKWPTYMVHTGG